MFRVGVRLRAERPLRVLDRPTRTDQTSELAAAGIWLSGPMSDANPAGDGKSTAAAARALAAVLIDVADAIASDDLMSVSSAMTEVRAAARQLEGSLTARGWGGDVLYGWGARDDQDEDDQDVADEDDLYSEDDADLDDEDEEGDQAIPESAIRLTCQSRSDFYLIDEAALTAYVMRRAAEAGLDWDHEFVTEHGAFYCFAELCGIDMVDLTGTGLVSAGGQNVVHEIEQTLWEMDETAYELRDDAFPTSQ